MYTVQSILQGIRTAWECQGEGGHGQHNMVNVTWSTWSSWSGYSLARLQTCLCLRCPLTQVTLKLERFINSWKAQISARVLVTVYRRTGELNMITRIRSGVLVIQCEELQMRTATDCHLN